MHSRLFSGNTDSRRGLGSLRSGRGEVTNRSLPFSIFGDARVNMITSGLHLVHFRLFCPVPPAWASYECAGIPGIHGASNYDLLQMSWMFIVTPDLSQEGSGALAEPGSQSRSASGSRVRNNEKLCANAAGEKRGLRSLITESVCDTGHSEQNSGVDPRRSGCSIGPWREYLCAESTSH